MMEGENCCSSDKTNSIPDGSLTSYMFSWSVEDIFNDNLYQNQVEKIPDSFQSVKLYLQSYLFPLLEETRAKMCSSMETISRAPFAEIIHFDISNYQKILYDVTVDYWRNRFSDHGQEPYRTLPGDIFVITDAKPETFSDLLRVGRTCNFAVVTKVQEDVRRDEDEDISTDEENRDEDDGLSTYFKVQTSKSIEVEGKMQQSLYVIFLINITTNRRIWNALHMVKNLKIINKVLRTDTLVDINCNLCLGENNGTWDENFTTAFSSILNDSQMKAVWSCLRKMDCGHRSSVELIWGPPGTGKTKTVCSLLITLLRMNFRILACAPANIAIKEMASRVLKLVKESFDRELGMDGFFCSFGDILLFGNNQQLKVGSDMEEIYLDNRVQRLMECFGPQTGWRHCFLSMIDFLENCVSQYHISQENELLKEKKCESEGDKEGLKSFVEYARDRFVSIASLVRRCVINLCTHIPKSYLLEYNFRKMEYLFGLLNSFENLLFQDNLVSQELEEHFSHQCSFMCTSFLLSTKRSECLSVLTDLRSSLGKLVLPSNMNKYLITEFCFQRASLIFCTVCNSYKLHSVEMEPLNLLVIDEAAQLKECESIIPLQLSGISHAILIGDECQLQATVYSVVCNKAGFGRSLFERLSSLGHSKHLLYIQYRMHPFISCFPNSRFYFNQISNGQNVTTKSYERHYLQGPMFGPYSFINIFDGREELDDVGYSRRNMVEVAAVIQIVRNLHKVWIGSRENVSVGVISPYAAQVQAIHEKIGKKYEKLDGFSVKVKTVDGFQGGEEDIIIISTVRSNRGGSVGFISNHQRTNVALTRARHSLWILGNERTLINSESIWEALVRDAKARNCFFNADKDKDLAKAILEVKKELDQLDDLLDRNSMLFKSCRWKVFFSYDFKNSFANLRSAQTKKSVINVLLKLSSGWRPKQINVDSVCGSSSHILKQFKVRGLYIICTIDIMKESGYLQVLKIWDILPLEEIPKLVKRLNGIFVKYTDDYINHCQEKCLEGGLEVPKCWVSTTDIKQFKSSIEDGTDSNGNDDRRYVENSKVSESLLLMKFYQLSSDVVTHLLSDRDVRELDLPFEVTEQEREIILFDRSTFILGRSGTGKTTVLTMKLFQKEKLHHIATEAIYGVKTNTSKNVIQRSEIEEGSKENKRSVLKQLFVTVSSKLCCAVKQHVSHLKSFAHGGDFSAETSSLDMDNYIDDTAQFKDIPDSFVDIPPTQYPLVMTLYKFLMMLDGTLGISYFQRFHDVSNISQGGTGSLRSAASQTFIRMREVNYDKFSSSYWPHFNSQLTKRLEPSRVYTEIMSHIKGGLQAGKSCDVKLSREGYVLLSKDRISTLDKKERNIIYDIFQDYEKMKKKNGEFDLADLVIDLHQRLKYEKYEGAEIDYVYIDEVQDLTMRQIALFKYVCRNVKEGFVFSGDTAQTIARGIDFRFQDIRSLFYNEFVLETSCNEGNDGRKEKGKLSEIFHLCQNFRTHVGVLKLAQSVIELLYRFFPQSIDILSPETSLIYGEAPVLLESGNDENAIITIFGNIGNSGRNSVGFGSEQVILVRDDCARKEISGYVGKQALVLTIIECKGLEFQDVLLYNFFGSSPVKNRWRVIYEYMKEKDLLDATSTRSYPTFNQAKHNILCSELKHLYVAITRTRQRLWICENVDEFSEPIFDYWRKLNIVQVTQLDASLAQAMQVASSTEEWRSRGLKLISEKNYEMATMCFERAGDTYWEKYAKAAGLRAAADRMYSSNPEMAGRSRREAADIFEYIGNADAAAECFYLLEEFERAGGMAGKVLGTKPVVSFEYELFEDDIDDLRTVVATPSQTTPWIDPAMLKLRHRIGRGPFGDVWLATYHRLTEDYEQYHEVAVKMLHPIKDEHKKDVLDKFDALFSKCQGMDGVCWLNGISIIDGKICIIMKFYEGSIGDRMARLNGGKLSLPDALRYGINLAQGILELHSKEILVLNLKPFNYLLTENDQAILGDIGIPFLLLGVPLPSSDMARRLGTPNYMAPEQWQPDVRGPLSFETDSWGFGCSIVEMLSGVQPWSGKSTEEIYQSVIEKQERPLIPNGLPPAVENVILGCFAYDFRSRPLMAHILQAFKSSQNAIYNDGSWAGLGGAIIADKSSGSGYTEWFLSKDRLQVGDIVRSRKSPNSCKPENMDVPEGTIVGLERDTDRDGFLLVRVHGIHDPLRVYASTLERVTNGLAAGDWVRLKLEDKKHSPVGTLHSINRDGSVAVGFIGVETLWKGNSSELQMAESYCVGQFVRLKANAFSPRFEWPRKRGGAWATGRISRILPNGCLVVKFPGRLAIGVGDKCSSFLADPAEVEVVSFNTSLGMVKKYQHLEDFHWAVRPLLIALGLFTAMKLGIFVGKKIGKPKMKKSQKIQKDGQHMDGHSTGNSAWLPPPVANMIFREGATTATAR